jgi:hypothetical protein
MRDTSRLQAALRKTTEGLAHELAEPSDQTPDWSRHEWSVARAVAAMHGVSPMLAGRLRWQGPSAWRDFLAAQFRHTELRHRRVNTLLALLHERALETGIKAIALKGAALYAMGFYIAGERPMADIDLLVCPCDASTTARMIESLGFIASEPSWKEQVFTPYGSPLPHVAGRYGEHVDNDVKIELHQRICERLPLRIVDITRSIWAPEAVCGINPYPSKSALMLHLLFHAAGAIAFQSVRLIQLQDIASLAQTMNDDDWAAIWERRSHGALWWLWPPLHLVARYFPVSSALVSEAQRDCPARLLRAYAGRSLSDVSFSYLPIDAFPGVDWAGSMPERWRYRLSRLRPSVEQLAMRKVASKSEDWAAATSWSAMSQSRRVLGWLLKRPGRPATLHAVNAALAES